MRSVRYQEIADDLRGRIATGDFSGGRLLPSEAQLAETFLLNRVTLDSGPPEFVLIDATSNSSGFWSDCGWPSSRTAAAT